MMTDRKTPKRRRMMPPKTKEEQIETFQCPGCVCGSDTGCERFKLYESSGWYRCQSHVPGTTISGIGSLYLGLPKGFCRVGMRSEAAFRRQYDHPDAGNSIRIWEDEASAQGLWDWLNAPVWAMVKDEVLFVRTYAPRINETSIDIVPGGTLELVPQAIDIGPMYDEID